MLPLNDTEKNRYSFFPVITVLLIMTNCFIFYMEPYIVDSYWNYYMKFGTTPLLIRQMVGGGTLSNITAMFLHGDLFHLLGNMLPLWVFASGAIFGLMGAYLLLYPGGRIRTLVFVSFVPLWPRIRAVWIVLYFFGIQIIPAIEIMFGRADYRVNYWAHLGGFFSAIFVLLFLRPEAYARYMSDVSV